MDGIYYERQSGMPRATRTDVDTLKQELRAMEMLANEADIPLDRVQDYWSASTDLINLSAAIEDFGESEPNARGDDPRMLALRRRLREIASRLALLSME